MKKSYYFYALIALTVIAVSPTIIFAEESTSTIQRLRAVGTNAEQKIERTLQNVNANKDLRNTLTERRGIATSTNAVISGTLGQAKVDITNASTTKDRREIRVELRRDVFQIELNRIVRQITRSLDNLKQIRTRIEARIQKATDTGRDMTKANSLLATADGDILLAKNAIVSLNDLASSTPPTSAVSVNVTSAMINLERPRQIGADAIRTVNKARNTLNSVVVAIAHDMGLRLVNTSPTPSVSPTISQSVSPTPSPSPTASPSDSPTPTPTVTPTTTPTITPTITPSPTISPTPTPSP